MNTAELVVEMRPEKIQVRTWFEPMTSAISVFKSCMGLNFFQVLFQQQVQ